MNTIDSKVLRRLAARYRERAQEESNGSKAKLFAEIADEMEADARRLERS